MVVDGEASEYGRSMTPTYTSLGFEVGHFWIVLISSKDVPTPWLDLAASSSDTSNLESTYRR